MRMGRTFRNRTIGQAVHAHGHRKVLQVVEEGAKDEKFLKCDAFLFGIALQQSVQVFVVPARIM
jgi:hypothetical protein